MKLRAAKIAAATVQASFPTRTATRTARMAAMIRLTITIRFMPRACSAASLNAIASAASCMRSR